MKPLVALVNLLECQSKPLVALVNRLASAPLLPFECKSYRFVSQSASMIVTWQKTKIPSESIIGSGYPFQKHCHPFERLGLSVREKKSYRFEQLGLSVRKSCYLFKQLGLSVQKRSNCRNNCRLLIVNQTKCFFWLFLLLLQLSIKRFFILFE